MIRISAAGWSRTTTSSSPASRHPHSPHARARRAAGLPRTVPDTQDATPDLAPGHSGPDRGRTGRRCPGSDRQRRLAGEHRSSPAAPLGGTRSHQWAGLGSRTRRAAVRAAVGPRRRRPAPPTRRPSSFELVGAIRAESAGERRPRTWCPTDAINGLARGADGRLRFQHRVTVAPLAEARMPLPAAAHSSRSVPGSELCRARWRSLKARSLPLRDWNCTRDGNRGGAHPRPVRYRCAMRTAQRRVDRHPARLASASHRPDRSRPHADNQAGYCCGSRTDRPAASKTSSASARTVERRSSGTEPVGLGAAVLPVHRPPSRRDRSQLGCRSRGAAADA